MGLKVYYLWNHLLVIGLQPTSESSYDALTSACYLVASSVGSMYLNSPAGAYEQYQYHVTCDW